MPFAKAISRISKDQPGLPVGENFSEAMNNPIISSLRAKYLDLTNREADWAARYGARPRLGAKYTQPDQGHAPVHCR